MSVAAYPEYRESGFEWFGQVPVGWPIVALKRDLEFLTSGSRGWADHYADEGAFFIRIGNLRRESLALDCSDIQRVAVPPGAEGERTRLRPGDVLFSITAFMGSVAVVPEDIELSYVSQHVALARLNGRLILPEWVGYTTLSSAGKAYLDSQCYGGTKIQLSLDDVANLPIAVPSLNEQRDLVTFLNRETGKIDALVAEQERLMALLKEKRQAVISQAVTKGLDPNVPMKDSGVEWLGEVPAHWSRPLKLRDLARRERNSFVNGPFGSDLLSSELMQEGVPVVYIRDLKYQGYIRTSDVCVTVEKAKQLEFCNVQPGDLLVAKVGDPPGLCVVYPDHEPAGIVTQDVIRLRVNDDACEAYFVRYLLNSDFGRSCIDDISVESTRMRVSLGDYKELPVVVPSIAEQKIIVRYLDQAVEAMEGLFGEARRGIELLKERRSALISAAVTGKIDVRGLVDAKAKAA